MPFSRRMLMAASRLRTRRALEKAGYGHIPVVSVNLNGMEKNEGFTLSKGLIMDAVHALVYGDLFIRGAADEADVVARAAAAARLRHHEGKVIGVIAARGHRLHKLADHRDQGPHHGRGPRAGLRRPLHALPLSCAPL